MGQRDARGPVAVSSQRIGLGVDVHPFAEADMDNGKLLTLGGVTFPGERALRGHSDADVLAHAIADAVLGAAGLGDLGAHFPDTDPRWRGADSLVLLAEVASLAAGAGWRLVNADCTLVGERPKVVGHRQEMIEHLSAAAGGPVHVKATRPEGLGSLGRVEGLACFAIALVEQLPAMEAGS
ncbi:MAG: ispF [Acidimicrobiaceae bacterium]|nr:ispF [Acidimicrobiaceae bacterium]